MLDAAVSRVNVRAGKCEPGPFNAYRALKKLVGRNSGLEVHHLIEKRFAAMLGVKEKDMLSVVMTEAEHQKFTNAWRQAIPYGLDTIAASKEKVANTAREIYKDYPAILHALGLNK